MKNIWIDGYEANVPQRVGSGQVAFQLLKNIEKIDSNNKISVLLTQPPKDDLPKPREGFEYKLIKPKRLKTFIGIPWTILRANPKPDVFFSPSQYIPRFVDIKRVGLIFDLSPELFPQFFEKDDLYKLTEWTKYTTDNASALITISESTKQDIIKFYGVDKNKIHLAYPGYDEQLFKPIPDTPKIEQVKKKYGIPSDYILYTGTIQPRKNLVNLIESFVKIEGLSLVLSGKYSGEGRNAWMTKEVLEAPKKFGIEEKVIFTNFVPNEDLPYLMAGATAYILPSFYEGFGIPPLEAMACGTPVIVSNVSSLPEVVGDAGLYIDPKSKDQIEQAIRTISTDKKLNHILSKKGLEQAKKFSWEKMARQVIKVLESV